MRARGRGRGGPLDRRAPGGAARPAPGGGLGAGASAGGWPGAPRGNRVGGLRPAPGEALLRPRGRVPGARGKEGGRREAFPVGPGGGLGRAGRGTQAEGSQHGRRGSVDRGAAARTLAPDLAEPESERQGPDDHGQSIDDGIGVWLAIRAPSIRGAVGRAQVDVGGAGPVEAHLAVVLRDEGEGQTHLVVGACGPAGRERPEDQLAHRRVRCLDGDDQRSHRSRTIEAAVGRVQRSPDHRARAGMMSLSCRVIPVAAAGRRARRWWVT